METNNYSIYFIIKTKRLSPMVGEVETLIIINIMKLNSIMKSINILIEAIIIIILTIKH